VVIGPLIDEQGLKKVEAHVADALGKGAKVILGGKKHERGGLFFQPTVLTNVTPQMLVSHEETFGRWRRSSASRRGRSDRLANDSEFGLAGISTAGTSAASGAWPRRWRPAWSA
jgi:succinate-semialdehyde dehydrogenase/glutarate-semialdehyde dehydrogenase